MPWRFPQHPDRADLQAEAHARPPMAIIAEIAEVWHWALTPDPDSEKSWPSVIDPHLRHQLIDLENGVLRYERHTEFFAITWAGQAQPDHEAATVIMGCPGQQLAGSRIVFVTNGSPPADYFGQRRVYGGKTQYNGIIVTTDFELDQRGLVTYVVKGEFEDEYARGRFAKRLLDLETYRMAALLALPVVRRQIGDLQRLETVTAEAVKDIRHADDTRFKETVNRLSSVLAELGELSDSVRYRLAASRAYYDLVVDRLNGLKEEPVGQRQTLRGFVEHRLAPAMKTAEAFERRLSDLSAQVSDSLALARTRLDVSVQEQNQRLLASMEERARQQVHLSEAVEGLSTAAITYYAVGLFAYLLKGLPDFFISDKILIALSVPLIGFLVWRTTRKATRKILGDNT